MSAHDGSMNKHTAEFHKKASALGHDVQDLGSIAKELAGDAVERLQENASEYYDQGMKKANALKKNLEKTIIKKPMMSLLIAAGIGLVAGALLKRR